MPGRRRKTVGRKAHGYSRSRGCGSLKGSMRTGEVATYQMTTPGEHVLHFDN
jgi:hypothetical protein